jgi:short-subunit dehydrogenase
MQDTPLFRLMARPEPVVQAALRGLARNQAVVVPGLANAALAASVRLTPRGAARRIAGRLQR